MCRACSRHYIVCQYPNPAGTTQQNGQSHILDPPDSPLSSGNKRNGSNGPDSHSEGPTTVLELPESRTRRLLEMKLLHNFTANVAQTMPGGCNAEVHNAWAKDVPTLALDHPALLHALLSFSALHIATTSRSTCPIEIRKSLEPHRLYMTLALSQHNNALSRLDRSNADAVCLTCILISALAFRTLQEDFGPNQSPSSRASPQDKGNDYTSILLQRLTVFHGCGETFRSAWSWLRLDQSGSIAAVIAKSAPQYAEAHAGITTIDPVDGRLVWPAHYAAPFGILLPESSVAIFSRSLGRS